MPWKATLDKRVAECLPTLKWLHDEPLMRHTSFRIGGPAARMAFPATVEALVVLDGLARSCGVRVIWLGNGTNVLFPDEGIDALVIATTAMKALRREGNTLLADAGVSLARLATEAWRAGLTGLEFAHGIPGSLGGGVAMNAGAHGGALSDVLTEAVVLFPDGVRRLSTEELKLSYRRSVFTEQPEAALLRARLSLAPGERDAIRARMDKLAAKRRASQPLEFPSAGSTFQRPTGDFAGRLIEVSGLKGVRVGGAEVSAKHAGFIVNRGGATCADVLALMERVQQTVLRVTGVTLEPELRIIR